MGPTFYGVAVSDFPPVLLIVSPSHLSFYLLPAVVTFIPLFLTSFTCGDEPFSDVLYDFTSYALMSISKKFIRSSWRDGHNVT